MNGKKARALRRASKLHPHAPSRRRQAQGLKTRWKALPAKERPQAAKALEDALRGGGPAAPR